MNDEGYGNRGLGLLDIITVLSFVLQILNNDELFRQATNNDIIDNLHKDIARLTKDNRELCMDIMKQNEMIIELLNANLEKGG